MKKLHFFGLLALTLVLALGMAFIACSSNSDSDDSPEGSFTITGIIEGQDVEAIISKSSKAAYNIATGDYYIIRFVDGDVISRGTIEWEDPMVRFIPDDGADPFYGYYTAGTLEINDIPYGTGTYKLGGQAPGAGTNNFPNLGPGSPWSNFKTAQGVVTDAYDAAYKAAKDAGKTDAQADTEAKTAIQDLVDEFEDLVIANMEATQLKNLMDSAGQAGSPFYPQDLIDGADKTVVYYVASKVSTATFTVSAPSPEWTPASYSVTTGNASSGFELSFKYQAIEEPPSSGIYLIDVEYLISYYPTALITVVWTAKAGDLEVESMDYTGTLMSGADATHLVYGGRSMMTAECSDGDTAGDAIFTLHGSGLGFYIEDYAGAAVASTSATATVTNWGVAGTPIQLASDEYKITVIKP